MAMEVLVDFLGRVGGSIMDPLSSLWFQFVDTVPGIIAAIIVVIVGYVVARLISHLVEKGLVKLGLDRKVHQLKLSTALGGANWSKIIALVLKWYVFLAFLTPAASLLKLGMLSEFIMALVLWAPSLIAAILIAIFGLIVADISYSKIANPKKPLLVGLAKVTKFVIIFTSLLVALGQIGINIRLAENTVLILVAGLSLGIAIAIGIAFGNGLKQPAKEMCEKFAKY